MRTICIIQARLASRRLPRKVMLDIGGQPMINHVIQRACQIKRVDEVVLNVPFNDSAELVSDLIVTWPVPEQEADVLASFLYIADHESADAIMRLTGDCPLLDPALCSELLALFLESGVEYATTSQPWTQWADGLDCEVFSRTVLERTCREATTDQDREHVCTWMARNCRMTFLYAPMNLVGYKWSVDTYEDLARARAIYRHLMPGEYGWRQTLEAEHKALDELIHEANQ